MSELSKFISERYVDLMETLNREHDQEQIEQTMKGFTIRLTDSSLGTLDNIARFPNESSGIDSRNYRVWYLRNYYNTGHYPIPYR
jgi:hypothetical protein